MQRERFEHLLMYDRVTITIELKDLKLLLLFTTKINFWVFRSNYTREYCEAIQTSKSKFDEVSLGLYSEGPQ